MLEMDDLKRNFAAAIVAELDQQRKNKIEYSTP
jgi:hypothetical protein